MEGSTLFDPILIQIIHVGEETGNIGEVLKKMSEYYRDLLQTKIDILMEFLQPVLMIIIGAVIGLIVGSIYIPIINLVNVIQ
jgi:type II secretory pathway component PulF